MRAQEPTNLTGKAAVLVAVVCGVLAGVMAAVWNWPWLVGAVVSCVLGSLAALGLQAAQARRNPVGNGRMIR